MMTVYNFLYHLQRVKPLASFFRIINFQGPIILSITVVKNKVCGRRVSPRVSIEARRAGPRSVAMAGRRLIPCAAHAWLWHLTVLSRLAPLGAQKEQACHNATSSPECLADDYCIWTTECKPQVLKISGVCSEFASVNGYYVYTGTQ